MASSKKLAAVVLASGFSVRFGSNKLMQKIGSRTLFEIAILNASSSDSDQVAAVVEPGNVLVRSLVPSNVVILENTQRGKGLSSAVKCALTFLGKGYDGYLFLAADQPFFHASLINSMIGKFRKEQCGIVCASPDGTLLRNPMLFSSAYFDELMHVEGDTGAKSVADGHRKNVCIVRVSEEDLFDVDTSDDLEKAREIMGKRRVKN